MYCITFYILLVPVVCIVCTKLVMLSVNIESHIIGSGGMHQISYRLISKVKLVIELSVITGQCAIEKTKTTHPDPVKLA